MKKFVVSYSNPHEHVVEVGIEASSPKAAINKAKKLAAAGKLWDDTHKMPLLRDDFEETDGTALEFEARSVNEFPQPDLSVQTLNIDNAASELVRAIADRKVTTLADIVNKAKEIMGHETGLWQPKDGTLPNDMPSFGVFRTRESGMLRYPGIPAAIWVRYRPGDIEQPTFMD